MIPPEKENSNTLVFHWPYAGGLNGIHTDSDIVATCVAIKGRIQLQERGREIITDSTCPGLTVCTRTKTICVSKRAEGIVAYIQGGHRTHRGGYRQWRRDKRTIYSTLADRRRAEIIRTAELAQCLVVATASARRAARVRVFGNVSRERATIRHTQ